MTEKVIEILSSFTECPTEEISMKSKLATDLGMSSLQSINAIVAFEDEFGIEIPEKDIRTLQTVGDVVEYLKNLKQEDNQGE